MKYSKAALFILAIKLFNVNGKNAVSGKNDFSNADFFKIVQHSQFDHLQKECEKKLKENINEFYRFKDSINVILNDEDGTGNYDLINKELTKELIKLRYSADGFICYFDNNFPQINPSVNKDSEKPFLLFYKGDVNLLSDLNRNVAIIGVLNPDESIIAREKHVVRLLVEKGMNVVSGLARGCDTVAHMACMEAYGKTIAILPSTFVQILPSENRQLAYEIVENGGLLITEYFLPPKDRFAATKRYIDRDRLQAMFSKAIVLSASYNEKSLGDCGSRHAMNKAEEYSIYRTIIYNYQTDYDKDIFGLNREYYESNRANVLTSITLNKLVKHTMNYNKSYTQQTL